MSPCVQTVYVLSDGTFITTLQQFELVKNRFDWLDKKTLVTEFLYARMYADNHHQTIVAAFETNKQLKVYLNLPDDFHISDLEAMSASVPVR
ncbi:MAG: hypothetical protein ABI415_00515 [Flavitalea sp.]